MVNFEAIKELIANCEKDNAKADKGNKSAAKRQRKSMQTLKDLAQKLRLECLALMKQGEEEA